MSIEIIETRIVDKKAICIVPRIVWLCRSEFNKFNNWGTFLFFGIRYVFGFKLISDVYHHFANKCS